MALVGADDAVDRRIRERQHRQLAQEVVEARVGQLCEQALELVHRGLEDEDLVEAVEAGEGAPRGVRSEYGDDAAHFWLK
jgi:hypothetical protein